MFTFCFPKRKRKYKQSNKWAQGVKRGFHRRKKFNRISWNFYQAIAQRKNGNPVPENLINTEMYIFCL